MSKAHAVSGLTIILAGSFIATALLSGQHWGGWQIAFASVVGLTAWLGWMKSELRRSAEGAGRG